MNCKGQAYSTFKLLIAAIVAMAILAILIPIIMQVMGLIKANPLNETKSLLSELIDSPGALKHTKEVVFEPNSVLAGSALAERVPIAKDQICMSTGQFLEDPERGFECLTCGGNPDDAQQRIRYHGHSDQTAKIAIVCNVNMEELRIDLDDYGLTAYDGTDIDTACGICDGKGKCCAIVLERS